MVQKSYGLRPLPLAPTFGKRAVRWWLCCASSSALLGLLVVGCCFECFGFPVEHAEASWLLEVGFYGIFNIAVTLDLDIVVSGFQKLLFGRPTSIFLPWGPFCHVGLEPDF